MSKANGTEAFKAFLETCNDCVVFYGFVCDGMPGLRRFVEDSMRSHSRSRSDPYRVGVGTPFQGGLYPASLSFGEVLDKSDHEGDFQNLIAKLTIVAINSMWEDRYRGEIAMELRLSGKKKQKRNNRIEADLMAEARHIRDCIVHQGSKITGTLTRLKALKWSLCPGQLRVTRGMMVVLMDQINHMEIRVADES